MKRTVLVVDDVTEVAEELLETLRRLDVTPLMATDATSAKQILLQNPVDLAIIDLRLRHEQGIDLLTSISDRSQTKVVFLSGLDDQILRNAEEAAREAGFQVPGHLTKPVDNKQLARLLEAAFSAPKERLATSDRSRSLSEEDINRALSEGLIQPFFQPQYNLVDGTLEGFEALARLVTDDGRQISGVGSFAHFLDSGDFVWPIFASIARQAIKQFREGPGARPNIRLSINVPARACGDARFPADLISWCRDVALSPERVTLELTETTLDLAPNERLGLTKARVSGFELSLDDFGSGAANLDRLEQVPFTEVKLDAWFLMRTLTYEQGIQTLLEASAFLRKRNVRTVVEGVENPTLLERVAGELFDVGQGYYFGRPMPARDAFSVPAICEKVVSVGSKSRELPTPAHFEVLTHEEKDFLRELWSEPDDVEASTRVATPSHNETDSARRHRHACLIVEDDADTAEEIRGTLSTNGAECMVAATITEAQEAMTRTPNIGILLLDLRLPDGHGLDLLEHMRGRSQRLKPQVIVITGHGSEQLQTRLNSVDSISYLEKPVSAQTLRAAYDRARQSVLDSRITS